MVILDFSILRLVMCATLGHFGIFCSFQLSVIKLRTDRKNAAFSKDTVEKEKKLRKFKIWTHLRIILENIADIINPEVIQII